MTIRGFNCVLVDEFHLMASDLKEPCPWDREHRGSSTIFIWSVISTLLCEWNAVRLHIRSNSSLLFLLCDVTKALLFLLCDLRMCVGRSHWHPGHPFFVPPVPGCAADCKNGAGRGVTGTIN